MERTDRNDPLTVPRVKTICAGTEGATLCWNKTSKRAALMVKAPAFMDEDGVPILRVKLLRPMATEILALSEFLTSYWEEIDDAMFEHLWQTEVDAVPEFTTSKITLICGLLLPIWDRLPANNMRIYRLQTEDGQKRCLLVGPEGGFIDYEVELAQSLGATVAHLGNRILSVDTAVCAVLARDLY